MLKRLSFSLLLIFLANNIFSQIICENFQTEDQFDIWSIQNISSGVDSSWHWGQEFGSENIFNAHHSYIPTSDSYDDWLISPSFNTSDIDSPALIYTEYIGWFEDAEEHNVYYSTDFDGNVENSNWTLLNSDILPDADNNFISRGPFEVPSTSNLFIAFQYVGTNASNWWVDDICFINYDENYCPMPQINNWSTFSNSIVLEGNNIEEINSYQIEFSTSFFNPGDGSAEIFEFDTFPFELTGLEESTQYYFSIRSNCDNENYSEWYDNNHDGPDLWSTTGFACEPESNCSLGDGISGLIIGDIENTSSGCSENGYGNFTNLLTELELGQIYQATIVTNYTNQYISSWIDFNDDYTFTDEELIIDNYFITSSGTHEIDVLIPEDAQLGSHLMRFKANWNSEVEDACQAVSYGETEDYTVLIVDYLDLNNIDFIGMKIYPNPVGNNFVTILSAETGDKFVELFDINGRKVLSTTIIDELLDISNLDAGFYLIKVTINGKSLVSNLIIK